jgi:ribosome-associated protein
MMNKEPVGRMKIVPIERLPIELYQVLKLERVVATGGEAKVLIEQGKVCVNGEVEIRKAKKIFAGDIVEVAKRDVKFVVKEK